jgi:hypothetical protein
MPRLTSARLRLMSDAALRALLDEYASMFSPVRKMILREMSRRAGGHADRNKETKQ